MTPRPNEGQARSPLPDAAAIVRRARRLRFRVRPGAMAALSGAYLGARPGTGLTFAELKPYEPGDDVRHLDWNVTARQGRPYVRRFVEERALTLWLVVDVSASQRFGPPGATKADRSMQAAALLAAAAIQNGDRAGLLLVSDRIEAELSPSSGVRHLARLTRMLVATSSGSRGTDLAVAIPRLGRSARRALVVLIGDQLEPEPIGPWRAVARRNDLVAIRPVAPREQSLPDAGLIAIADAESGARRVVDTGSKAVRVAYARAARERAQAFRNWSAAVGADGLDLPTAEDPIGVLIRFFNGRAGRRQGHPR